MSAAGFDVFDRAVQRANEWLNDVAWEVGKDDDRGYAYRVLRSYLHTVRDRLPLHNAVDFAAQLPLLLTGVFYDGWNPGRNPESYRDARSFLDRLINAAQLAGPTEAAFVAQRVTTVLRRRMTPGHVDQLLVAVPEPIRRVLEPQSPATDPGAAGPDEPGGEVSVEQLPAELRSRVMAATGNADVRVVTPQPGDDERAQDRYEVYAVAGDRFTRMLLALRPDGSVEERTDTWPADEIQAVEIEADGSALRDRSDRSIPVPANLAVALAGLVAARRR